MNSASIKEIEEKADKDLVDLLILAAGLNNEYDNRIQLERIKKILLDRLQYLRSMRMTG